MSIGKTTKRKSLIYKHVYKSTSYNGHISYQMCIQWTNSQNERIKVQKHYSTEREAALAADKYLISIGKEPVNILKRK